MTLCWQWDVLHSIVACTQHFRLVYTESNAPVSGRGRSFKLQESCNTHDSPEACAGFASQYRTFAKRAGSSAPNYLKLVSEGQRNLTAEMGGRFAAALGLSGESSAYFCDLVAFNQAESASERERCYQAIQRYRRYRQAFHLDAAHAAYHAEWYIPAIRELAGCRNFREDPKWIARRLRPRISARQAQQALGVLEQLGLLIRNADNELVQQDSVLTTGDESPLGHHIATFHRAMLQRASEAIDTVGRDEREIAALTLAWISTEGN